MQQDREGACIIHLVWKLSTIPSFDITRFCGTKSKWRELFSHKLCEIASFFCETLCDGDIEIICALTSLFSKNASFPGIDVLPLSVISDILRCISMTSPLSRYNSYYRVMVQKPGRRRSYGMHNIVDEHTGVFAAACYYAFATATSDTAMPTWMCDVLCRVKGFHSVKRNWRALFPSISPPNYRQLLERVCQEEIAEEAVDEIMDIMCMSVMPMTFLTYSSGKDWEGHELPRTDLFPEMQKDDAAFSAAVYSICSWVARDQGADAEALYSYVQFMLEQDWTMPRETRFMTTAHMQLDRFIFSALGEPSKPSLLWLTKRAFGEICSVLQWHCLKHKHGHDWRNAWDGAVSAVQVEPVDKIRARSELCDAAMVNELVQLDALVGEWIFLRFDLSESSAQGLFLDPSKPTSHHARVAEMLSRKTTLDIYATMWWHYKCATQTGRAFSFRVMRSGVDKGFIAMPTVEWEVALRGLQWSISLCSRINLTRRFPAYMAVINMLLHPDEELARWGLVCIDTMISGLAPFERGNGMADIPRANTLAFRRCFSLLFQMATRCAISPRYGNVAGLIRATTCEGDCMLRAFRCLIQYGSKNRRLDASASVELMEYLDAGDNAQRIARLLQQHDLATERNQFALLCKQVEAGAITSIAECLDVLYLITCNKDYIEDDELGMRVFAGIHSTDKEPPRPATRSDAAWDTMAQIVNSNIMYNYFERSSTRPVRTSPRSRICAPIAKTVADVPTYGTQEFIKGTDIAVISTFAYLLEQDSYLRHLNGTGKRARSRVDDEDSNSCASQVSLDLANSHTGSLKSSRRKLVEPDALLEHSQASRTSFYEYSLNGVKKNQTGLKTELGNDCPLFPYLAPATYAAQACILPLALDKSNDVVYERKGLLVPGLPLAVTPEETRNRHTGCMASPIAGSTPDFLYSVMCNSCAFKDAVSKATRI